jgi:uncharacterized protein DUF4242
MQLYAVLRRAGWRSEPEARRATERALTEAAERLPDSVRWIRSYILAEREGALGSVCIFEATGPEAIRTHAALAYLPVTEILSVAETLTIRPDPEPVAA